MTPIRVLSDETSNSSTTLRTNCSCFLKFGPQMLAEQSSRNKMSAGFPPQPAQKNENVARCNFGDPKSGEWRGRGSPFLSLEWTYGFVLELENGCGLSSCLLHAPTAWEEKKQILLPVSLWSFVRSPLRAQLCTQITSHFGIPVVIVFPHDVTVPQLSGLVFLPPSALEEILNPVNNPCYIINHSEVLQKKRWHLLARKVTQWINLNLFVFPFLVQREVWIWCTAIGGICCPQGILPQNLWAASCSQCSFVVGYFPKMLLHNCPSSGPLMLVRFRFFELFSRKTKVFLTNLLEAWKVVPWCRKK